MASLAPPLDPAQWRDLQGAHWRLIAYAALAMLLSGVGQTYFISFFGSEIRTAFALSDAQYGSLYGGATLLSGLVLMRTARLVDTLTLGRLTLVMLFGAALAALIMAGARQVIWLFLALFLLRHFGQGMMSTIAGIALTRYFEAFKGRAMGLAAAGYTSGELLLPLGAAFLAIYVGWRGTFLAFAFLMLVLVLPLMLWLLRDQKARHTAWLERVNAPDSGSDSSSNSGSGSSSDQPGSRRRQWTLREALRDWRFYMLVPLGVAMPAIFTAVILHMESFIEARGWPQQIWVKFWAIYPLIGLATANIAGTLIDRITALRTLSFSLLPFAIGLLLLAFLQSAWALILFLVATGLAAGLHTTAAVTVWPELYGVKYLGDIRRVTTALMVISSALGPSLQGLLLGWGLRFETQYIGFAGFILLAQVLVAWVAFKSPVRVLRRTA
jgi:MFS family permease